MLRPALRRFGTSLCLVLLVMVVGCGGSSTAVKSDLDIDAFIQKYVDRSKARDSQGLADMFTDPANWTDPTGTKSLSRAEIKDQFDSMFDIVTTIYDMEATDVEATISSNVATVQFAWKQDVENAFLGRVQSEGKMTWQLQRIAGQWFIAHAQTQIDG